MPCTNQALYSRRQQQIEAAHSATTRSPRTKRGGSREEPEQLDVLARAVLVLHGCHRASFEDCVLLLNVPLQSAVGAYCTALEWYKAFTEPADRDAADATSATYIFPLRPKWTFGV